MHKQQTSTFNFQLSAFLPSGAHPGGEKVEKRIRLISTLLPSFYRVPAAVPMSCVKKTASKTMHDAQCARTPVRRFRRRTTPAVEMNKNTANFVHNALAERPVFHV